jgi:hypothetical protein
MWSSNTGTIIDSFHSSGNSSSFEIQLISLWLSEHNGVFPPPPPPRLGWVLLEFNQYLVICTFSTFQ